MRCSITFAALLAGNLALAGAQASAPAHVSVVAGRVRDALGHPLTAVTVTADSGAPAFGDDSGVFRVANLPPGRVEFSVMRIGYSPVSFALQLPPDTTVFLDVHMTAIAQTLPLVTTTGEAVSIAFTGTGFYDRQKHQASGYFVSPEQVNKLRLGYAAQFLMEVPGMRIYKKPKGPGYDVAGPAGCYSVFVDGVYSRLPLDDAVNGADVYAVEVYTRASDVPLRFQAPMRELVCGAVAFWTRKYAPAG